MIIIRVKNPILPKGKRFCAASLLMFLAAPALAGPREDFATLETEMEIAAEEYDDAVRRKILAERTGEVGAGTKPPVDRRPEILRRMDALAELTKSSPEGGYLAAKTYLWAVQVDANEAQKRLDHIAKSFPDEPLMEDAAVSAMELYFRSGTPDAWLQALERMAVATKRERTRQAALFAAGRIYVMIERPAAAKAAFTRLLGGPATPSTPGDSAVADGSPSAARAHPDDSDYVTQARGELFDLENLQVGMVAPAFTATTVDGHEVSLASLRGKVVLLKFWASWCVPCLVEIPRLQEASVELAGSPFELLAVSVDRERRALLNTLETLRPPGIQTWDLKGADNPVAALYNVRQYPTSFLLDADGVIRARHVPADQLVEMVRAVLPKTPGSGEQRGP